MYSQLFKAQQKHQVALEVLTYHCCVLDNETQQRHESVTSCVLPNDFYRYQLQINYGYQSPIKGKEKSWRRKILASFHINISKISGTGISSCSAWNAEYSIYG